MSWVKVVQADRTGWWFQWCFNPSRAENMFKKKVKNIKTCAETTNQSSVEKGNETQQVTVPKDAAKSSSSRGSHSRGEKCTRH